MTASTERSNVARYERELLEIEKRIGEKESREADLFKRINSSQASASRASNGSLAQTYLREVARHNSDIERVKSEKSRLFGDKTRKLDQLRYAKERLAREEASERQKVERQTRQDEQRAESARRAAAADADRRRIADESLRRQEAMERQALRDELEALKRQAASLPPLATVQTGSSNPSHDFFISHASEDKEGFVRALATALRERGCDVWYDEFSLRVGDSLRRSIDKGIANSKFGVVVLSPDFFKKEWPQRELDGLYALDSDENPKVLPIWHRVSYDEVAAASPILAGKLALKTALHSLEEIVDQLVARLPSEEVNTALLDGGTTY